MIPQNNVEEYRDLGGYLDYIRRGKNIPYRILEENGLSSRTFQRIKKGEADITLSSLSILTEILCLSPLEVNLKAENYSFTVQYRKQFMAALKEKKPTTINWAYGVYKDYYDSTSFTLGKLSVLYMMQALSLLYNPDTTIKIEEVLTTENEIIDNLEKAEVYTLFDLEFLALQNLLGLQKIDFSLVKEVLVTTDYVMADYRTKSVIVEFIKNLLMGCLKNRNTEALSDVIKIINQLNVEDNDWPLHFLKKMVKSIGVQYLTPNDEQLKKDFKQQQLALEVILPDDICRQWLSFMEMVQDSLTN